MEREHEQQHGPGQNRQTRWYAQALPRLRASRHARWAVPVVAVVAAGAVVAGTAAAGAQTAPSLPARTPAQLLASLSQGAGPGPMTATVAETANLGLPSMPGQVNELSPFSLLSGTHAFQIWAGGPGQLRIAEPVQLGESDLRLNGRAAWLWNSKTQTATHLLLPARTKHTRLPMRQRAGAAPTPLAAARQVLAAIGPTTAVSVQRNVVVAGRAAYQLAVAPKSSGSLIGRVTIAVDAAGHFPLRVQVFARGGTSPAFQIGFTALTLGKPAASNFTFTPPSGAKVKTVKVPASGPFGLSGMALPGMVLPGIALPGMVLPGGAHGRCLPPPGVLRGLGKKVQFKLAIRGALRRGTTGKRVKVLRPGTLRRVLIRRGAVPCGILPDKALKAAKEAAAKSGGLVSRQGPRGSLYAIPSKNWVSYQPMTGGSNPTSVLTAVAAPRPTVMGKGWLSVLVIRPNGPPVSTATVGGKKVTVRDTGLGGQQVIVNPKNGQAVSPGALSALPPYLRSVLNAGSPVRGAWGSGRLIRTTLFSALITSNGTVLIGAVTPAVLYAAAAK
jgi:hypothetical protein